MSESPRAANLKESKVRKAFTAMMGLGIKPEVVKPVLKKLLKLYDGNWKLIEEDNYRTLADAIFEIDDKSKSVRLPDEQTLQSRRSQSPRTEDEGEGSSTRQNSNMMGPPQRRPIMEKNADYNQRARNFIPEGSTSSNTSSVMQKKKRQINERDDDIEPITKSIRPDGRLDDSRKLYYKVMDITRGTEKIKISLVDEVGIELPKFGYIPQNTPYQDAYVPFSLARISDDGCCRKCIGDCLSSRVPCACSRETGGEFAYTTEGLLKHDFLEDCISMNLEPQKHHLFHCQDCPLEKAKNVRNPEACKGHVLRKFIKECWRKCGCSMECGNRVVQRGPTAMLQVFSTAGKGWGVRTLEKLPKGSFICEYIGEILTNTELYERNMKSQKNERHTYPVYLDADWGSEQVLKDEEALCLDATYYGNVARFINHRCFDSNLIEIPVEVETPDHHYYHIAFFTKKDVDAYEELNWDYGIDFQDDDHPIKAFECQCESSYCRDARRKAVSRNKEKALGVKKASGSSSMYRVQL